MLENSGVSGVHRPGGRPPGTESPHGRRPRGAHPAKRPQRALPVLTPAKRHLPLADQVRAVDTRARPLYAVWEITLRCDLACRHCGSRAGVARPDELSTAECLELVRQMAELGVQEVTVIGGEAYLRDDWLEIVRAIRAHGMQCGMTSGGRGITPSWRKRPSRPACRRSVSPSTATSEP